MITVDPLLPPAIPFYPLLPPAIPCYPLLHIPCCRYGCDWAPLFPALARGRSGAGQAVAQLAALTTTLASAWLGGLLAGGAMLGAARWEGAGDDRGDTFNFRDGGQGEGVTRHTGHQDKVG